MTSFKLVKYISRINKKKNGLRKLARKVPTDRLHKFERVFKAQKRINMSVFKAQRVLDEIRWRYYEETVMILNLMPYRASYPILKLVYSAALFIIGISTKQIYSLLKPKSVGVLL